ncbi:hypothetical protein JOY44_27765 (plasmid) [Phormidium sp. CLA17]|uniref:hypothetical protein n=1 Tax=Leptolyngbya sp. Cla-17 TaxID=2803751 RepID=UPI001492E2D5|nr:hypothetical protein [Leptolyngbya sp. Cla-17]MBM0745272.1 hypothetical protein [Leptolyngbya sp. Cla-17]
MKNYPQVLRQVGIIWIGFGITDIFYLLYSVVNGKSYFLGWYVLAIAVGVLLFRENLKVACWTGDAAAFLLVGIFGFLLTSLLMRPLELWKVHLQLYPIHVIYFLVFHICLMVGLSWTHQQLRNRVVLQACAAAGMKTKFPKIAFGLFVGFIVSFTFLTHSVLNGTDAAEAKRLAQIQLGEQYAYHVTGLQWSGDQVSAKVTAYSNNEIRFTKVNWSRKS